MRWAGHVTCIGKMRNHTKFWLETLKGRDHLEDLGIDRKIILEWILGKWVKSADAFISFRIGTSGGLL
jgi:hypothetical protein